MRKGNSSSEDLSDQTRTTIEVDRDAWRQVRSRAVAEGKTVSEMLEEVLVDYFDLDER